MNFGLAGAEQSSWPAPMRGGEKRSDRGAWSRLEHCVWQSSAGGRVFAAADRPARRWRRAPPGETTLRITQWFLPFDRSYSKPACSNMLRVPL
jgi:hypothetical protein